MTGSWLVSFKPFSSMVFKPPWGVFGTGVYGPAATGRSLSYPLPSTIAGALARLAYNMGAHYSGPADDFQDIENLIKELLGEEYALRPGLARVNGELYYYNGSSLTGLAGGRGEIKPARTVHVGIALDRRRKASLVLESGGLIYIAEHVYYRGMELVALTQGERAPMGGWIAKLGGEGAYAGYATVEVEDINGNPLVQSIETNALNAILATPALVELDNLPQSWPTATAVKAGRRLLDDLARALLHSSTGEVRNCINELVINRVPAGELGMEILQPGWSSIAGKPRKPHLFIPPGTTIRLAIRQAECLDTLAWIGLGAHSRIGWGTIILYQASQPH